MQVRKTKPEDLQAVLKVYARAREQMKNSGNPTQWGDSYPPRAQIEEDIELSHSFVIEDQGNIHGVFAFILGEDPTYQKIEGAWKSDAPYGTIHRLASGGTKSGIFAECLSFCLSIIPNIRIDTHRDNKTMQHLAAKNGFEFCGIIYVRDGTPRLAYQRCSNRPIEQ